MVPCSQELSDLLEDWRNTCFRSNEITLSEAVDSLTSESPLVEARPGQNPSRWIMFDTRSDKVAVLVHAGLWSWNSDLRSGNFVPPGKKAPEGLPDSRMQTEMSYKCEITYTIETSVDDSIYVLLKALEGHVCSQQNFNRSKRERRKWQDGTERQRFVMSSKMLVKKSPFNTTLGTPLNTPYDIHPWVLDALNEQTEQVYIANPESPRYLERQGEVLVDLFDTEDSDFRRGDIVWFSFKLGFYVNRDHWAPEIIPIAFVRVAVSPDPPVTNPDYSSYTTAEEDYDELKAGTIAIPITKRGSAKANKRTHEEDSGSETCDTDEDKPITSHSKYEGTPATTEETSPEPSTSSSKRRPKQRVRR